MEYGRYRILSQLGQGGMATVYLAEDPMLNRLVAIKVIQSHLAANASLVDRFTVEAKTIAALRHMNIVEVFDFGIQDNAQYLVMEFIDGQNLQLVCQALVGRPMSNEICAAIICQAAEGLTSAERNGVVHRDIKPENLLFNSEGILKIADFGIAHIADEQNRTQTGTVLGSPNFMSPEQIEGLRPSHKTDLFSLGGVFYYCLTGKLPFTGPSIPVTMRNICDHTQPSILELNPEADPFLVSLVGVLLQKNPSDRGEGARWLSFQLRSYLNSRGIVDNVERVRTFLSGLGLESNRTMAEGSPPMSSGSGMGKRTSGVVPRQSQSSANRNSTGSERRSTFDYAPQGPNNATTGAMGPSMRSPVLWIGVLISICLLVLAGVIFWTRMGIGESDTPQPIAVINKPLIKPLATTVEPTKVPPSTISPIVDPQPVAEPVLVKVPVKEPKNVSSMIDHNSARQEFHRPEPKPVTIPSPTTFPTKTPNPKVPDDDPILTSGQTGFVMVKSAPPFAALTVNGRPQGETPMANYLEVPVGKCHIEIIHRLHPPFDTTVNVTPGFRREFKFKLDH